VQLRKSTDNVPRIRVTSEEKKIHTSQKKYKSPRIWYFLFLSLSEVWLFFCAAICLYFFLYFGRKRLKGRYKKCHNGRKQWFILIIKFMSWYLFFFVKKSLSVFGVFLFVINLNANFFKKLEVTRFFFFFITS
jgi:hypothetical protein